MSESDQTTYEEAQDRFVPSQGRPTTYFDIPATEELTEALRERGLSFEHMVDDYADASTKVSMRILPGTPVWRIVNSDLPHMANPEARLRTAYSIVVDIAEGQFERNWAEYL